MQNHFTIQSLKSMLIGDFRDEEYSEEVILVGVKILWYTLTAAFGHKNDAPRQRLVIMQHFLNIF